MTCVYWIEINEYCQIFKTTEWLRAVTKEILKILNLEQMSALRVKMTTNFINNVTGHCSSWPFDLSDPLGSFLDVSFLKEWGRNDGNWNRDGRICDLRFVCVRVRFTASRTVDQQEKVGWGLEFHKGPWVGLVWLQAGCSQIYSLHSMVGWKDNPYLFYVVNH